MCECINEVGKNIVEKQPLERKEVLRADVNSTFIFSETKNAMFTRTYTDVELQIANKKRPLTLKVVNTFCPFCGVKYEPHE